MDRPLRILSVTSSSSFGGLERSQLELGRCMVERGHEVAAAAPPASPFGAAASQAGFEVLPFRSFGYIAPLGVLRLARHLRAFGPDVVHYRLSRDIWAVAPAARLAGRKGRVVHTLGMNPGGRLDNPVHRWLRATLGAFVCPTPGTAAAAERVWGMERGEAVAIPDFVDERRFEPSRELEARAKALRASWDLPEGGLAAGMLGRLEPSKGVETFLEAAERTAGDVPGLRFLVAGPVSPGREAWLDQVRERAARTLGERVRFAGLIPSEEVPAILRALDIFVLPSHRETFGLVLVEAMMAGTAVISTRGPGPDYILEEGGCGLLFDPRDAAGLADHTRRAVADPGLRAELARRGRERALSAFAHSVVVPRYEELFRRIALAGQSALF